LLLFSSLREPPFSLSTPFIRNATDFFVDQPKGTRLGVSEHPEDNLNVFKFCLSDADRADIEVVLDRSNGRKMITLIGDCGAEYR